MREDEDKRLLFVACPLKYRISHKCFVRLPLLICVTLQMMMPPHGNVFDILQEKSEFSQLVRWMKETGIADTLQEEGPFTIFAPTNKVSSVKVGGS